MMVDIQQPHGYLLDSEGRVVIRFGNWSLGERDVPDPVESIEYVDGPAAHTLQVDWRYSVAPPPVSLGTSADQLQNDGTTEATITMTLNSDADTPRDVTLTTNGEPFPKTLEPGVEATETITTTKQPGTTVTIAVGGGEVQRATTEIEVVSA